MRAFEDHCWKDIVTDEMLEIYEPYARELRVGKNPALLLVDLYNKVYVGGDIPVREANRIQPGSCGEYAGPPCPRPCACSARRGPPRFPSFTARAILARWRKRPSAKPPRPNRKASMRSTTTWRRGTASL